MKKLLIFIMVISLCAGCGTDNDKDEELMGKNLKIGVTIGDEQTIYPSLLLGIGLTTAQSDEEFDVFDIEFKNAVKGNVKIQFEATKLNFETIVTQSGCIEGQVISPRIKWDYDQLASCRSPGLVDFTVICYVDNIECDRHNLRVNYRSVNECVYIAINNETDDIYDFTWMFGAYVNENHTKIDPFLQKIISNGIVTNFVGYQRDDATVLKQVFSIWHELQLRGVTYSNVVMTSNPAAGVGSQYVRFFDEVLDNTQANCVDGTVFFSSILRKIGIEPILILIPGHMYLGYYDVSGESYFLLETTKIGGINLKEITSGNAVQILRQYIDEWITQQEYDAFVKGEITLTEMKNELSARSFFDATDCNLDSHIRDKDKFGNVLMYRFLPVQELRQIVQPIENATTRSAKTYSTEAFKDLGKVKGFATKGLRPTKAFGR